MNCAVLQPSYIPWRGYFHQIQKADIFVFYDDVQYDRHGWRNRNRIKTPAGPKWLTIPVKSAAEKWKDTPICRTAISWERNWGDVHFETLRHSYAKAPFFIRYRPMLERWYLSHPENLADFTISTTVDLAREMGIAHTQFIRSSALSCKGVKTDRLLAILKMVKASHYISGPSAKHYLEVNKLENEAISVEWMEYDYPDYPQLFPPFDPQVSIIDLLMMAGPESPKYIWNRY